MLYITSPWPIYFINGTFYLLTPFTHITHPLPSASGNRQSVLYLWAWFVCFVFVLDSTYKWDHVLFFFLCDLFHLA